MRLTRIIVPSALAVCTLPIIQGCGAEIRPDGPKRVVFTEPDGSQRVLSVAPSSELRAAAIDQLMAMTTDRNPQIRANAIEALSPVTERVEPVVALSINDPNSGVRAVAAMVVGFMACAALWLLLVFKLAGRLQSMDLSSGLFARLPGLIMVLVGLYILADTGTDLQ